MPDASALGWLIANVGIATIALILLDRSHRDAYKKMEEQYRQLQEQNQRFIESLQRVNERLEDRRVEAKHGP